MDPLRDLLMVKQPGRWSLRAAMSAVAEAGSGVVLLLGHPLDGDVLLAHIRETADAVPAKNRPRIASSAPVHRSCVTWVCEKCA